jgi:diguanylate cyclase (GGDEF)-like protein/PAS domain S-box-containing protein
MIDFVPDDERPRLRQEVVDTIEHLPDALIEADLRTERIIYMNRMALILFGYVAAETRDGVPGAALFAEGELDKVRAIVARFIQSSLETGSPYERSGRHELVEIVMRRKDGSVFPAETQSAFVLDEGGRPLGMRTIVRDVTQRKELERRLEEMSYRDPLTGCYNRRHLESRRADLERPTSRWACFVFDLDDLKAVNDSYGHEEGDRVLRSFAHFVARHHRPDDILVRMGGDEFGLIVRADSEGEAELVSKRLLDAAALDSPAAFSMGLAFRRPGEKLQETLDRADRTMYAARGKRLRQAGKEPT